MDNINYFDIIVLSLILMLGLKGLMRGLIKEAFALIGIVAGVYIASRVALNVGNFISKAIIPINDANATLLLGFVITLLCVWIASYMIGAIISKIFSLSGLGIFDKILGFMFGAGKIFFIFSIIVYAISNMKTLENKMQTFTENSVMFPLLKEAGQLLIKIDPVKIKNNINQNVDDMTNEAQRTLDILSNPSKGK